MNKQADNFEDTLMREAGRARAVSQLKQLAPYAMFGVGAAGLSTLVYNAMAKHKANKAKSVTQNNLRAQVGLPVVEKTAVDISSLLDEPMGGIQAFLTGNSNGTTSGKFVSQYVNSPFAYALPLLVGTALGGTALNNSLKKNYGVKVEDNSLDNEIDKFHNILKLEQEIANNKGQKPVNVRPLIEKTSAHLSDKDKEDIALVHGFVSAIADHLEKSSFDMSNMALALMLTSAMAGGAGYYNVLQARDKAKLNAVNEAIKRYKFIQPSKIQAVVAKDPKEESELSDLSNLETNVVPITKGNL